MPMTARFDEITKHRFDSLAPRKDEKSGPIRYEVRVLDDAQTAAVRARSRSFSELVNLPFQLACAMRAHREVFVQRGGVPDSLLCSVPVQTRRPGAAGPLFQNHLRMFFGQCLREELRTLEGTVASVAAQHQRYLKDGLDKAMAPVDPELWQPGWAKAAGGWEPEPVPPVPDSFFRKLTAAETEEFRAHARANYQPGAPIEPVWHPVYRDECRKMNAITPEARQELTRTALVLVNTPIKPR
jgi:hypothetical protein